MKTTFILTLFGILNLLHFNVKALSGEIIKITPSSGNLIYGHMSYDQSDSSIVFAGIDDNQQLIFSKFLNSAATIDLNFQNTSSFNATRIHIKKSLYGNYYFGALGDVNNHYFFKLDSNFNFLFCKGYFLSGINNPNTTIVDELPNGDFIGLNESSIIRFTSTGIIKWVKQFPNFGFNHFKGVKMLSNSKFIIYGDFYKGVSVSSNQDVFICCLDTSAQILWSKSIGSLTNEVSTCAAISNEGNLIIGGFYSDNLIYAPSKSFVAVFDTLGNLLHNNFLEANLPSSVDFITPILGNKYSVWQHLNGSLWVNTILDSDLKHISSIKSNLASIFSSQPLSDSSAVTSAIDANGNHVMILSKDRLPTCIDEGAIYFQEKYVSWNQVFLADLSLSNVNANLSLTYSGSQQTGIINQVCNNLCGVQANFSTNNNSLCVNSTVVFNNQSQQATNYSWFVNGIFVSGTFNLSHTFNTAGQQSIKLVASNGICSDTLELIYQIDAPPNASYTFQKAGRLLNCAPASLSNNNYLWDFGDGSTLNSFDSVSHVFGSLGTFNVCLNAQNNCGTNDYCELINLNENWSNSFQTAIELPGPSNYQYDIVQLANGDYMVAGQSEYSSSSPVANVVKLDKFGFIKKAFSFNAVSNSGTDEQYIDKIFLKENGEVYFTGFNKYFLSGGKTFYGSMDSLFNFNSRFVILNSINDLGSSITALPGNNYALVYTSNNETVLAKLDGLHNILWRKSYLATDKAKGVMAYDDGTIVVLCTNNTGAGLELFKTDSLGNLLWAYNYEGPESLFDIYNFEKTKSGNLLISGSNGSSPFILCVDSSGAVLWSKKYNLFSTNVPRIRNVVESLDGNIYFSFDQSFAPNGNDGYLCKADSAGNFLSAWKEYGYIRGMAPTMDSSIVAIAAISAGINSVIKFDRDITTPCSFAPDSGSSQDILINRSVFPFTLTNPIAPAGATGLPSQYYPFQPLNAITCSSINNSLSADFNYISTCAGIPMTFNSIINGNYSQVSWVFNGAVVDTSSATAPSALFNTAGTYEVILTVVDSFGNQVVHSENVLVSAFPTINLNNVSVCQGSSVQLIAYNGGNPNVVWYPAAGLSTTAGLSTMASPTQTTTYYATYTSAPGCSATDSSIVTVNPLPVLSATIPDTICMNEFVNFYASGANNYTWYAGNQLIAGGDTVGPLTFGNSYFIKLIGSNNFGCYDTLVQFMYQDTCMIVVGEPTIELSKNKVAFFPNPAHDVINIAALEEIEQVSLYDLTGRIIIAQKLNSPQVNVKFNIEGIAGGLYIMHVKTGQQLIRKEVVIF